MKWNDEEKEVYQQQLFKINENYVSLNSNKTKLNNIKENHIFKVNIFQWIFDYLRFIDIFEFWNEKKIYNVFIHSLTYIISASKLILTIKQNHNVIIQNNVH